MKMKSFEKNQEKLQLGLNFWELLDGQISFFQERSIDRSSGFLRCNQCIKALHLSYETALSATLRGWTGQKPFSKYFLGPYGISHLCKYQAQCSALQCSAAQRSAVQWMTEQCSEPERSSLQRSALQRSALQRSTVQCSRVQCAVLCLTLGSSWPCSSRPSTVSLWGSVLYSKVQYSTLLYGTGQ